MLLGAADIAADCTCIVMATYVQKRSSASSSDPLLNISILEIVLGYVGPGHYLFVASVSQWWREVYTSMTSQEIAFYTIHGCNCPICISPTTLISSAFTSLSRVKLAHNNWLDCSSEAYQHAAGRHADVAILATAHSLGMQYTDTVMAGAAQSNKLAELQFLRGQGCPWPCGMIETAASSGYFELLRWCHEHGCQWEQHSKPLCFAAQSGNVELLAWVLQETGTNLTESVMSTAAAKGHTAMCQYLYSQQCPWDANSTSNAATYGHVSVLRWLVDNGCPWDARELYTCATVGGRVDVLVYLQEVGSLTIEVLTELLDYAGAYEQPAAAKWLREQGAAWPTVFKRYHWTGEVLAWAIAEGFKPPSR
jgi:hypothetical protein